MIDNTIIVSTAISGNLINLPSPLLLPPPPPIITFNIEHNRRGICVRHKFAFVGHWPSIGFKWSPANRVNADEHKVIIMHPTDCPDRNHPPQPNPKFIQPPFTSLHPRLNSSWRPLLRFGPNATEAEEDPQSSFVVQMHGPFHIRSLSTQLPLSVKAARPPILAIYARPTLE